MSIEKFLSKLTASTEKMKDWAKKEQSGTSSTIMHPETYPDEKTARKAHGDIKFRAYYSSKKEFSRRLKG